MTANPSPDILAADLRQTLTQHFKRIVVFSGAGLSADSGIPTFRSGDNGLWSEFNPVELATPRAWKANKPLVWGWYEWRRGIIMNAQPNPAHLAIARLQHNLNVHAITQNVDDLHERAGVGDVLHLHGSMFAPRCSVCGRPHSFEMPPPETPLREMAPPECHHCKGAVRPGVVWFGENLSKSVMGSAERLIAGCNLLLVVGTSGVVHPAAGLVAMAPANATIIEINPSATPQTSRMNHVVRLSASQVLPAIADLLIQHAQKLSE